MTNKKGDIKWDNFLGALIAVAGLVLFYFLAKAYFGGIFSNQEMDNAKSFINKIKAKLDALSEGQQINFTIMGFDSKGIWYLTGWSKNNVGKPDECILSSCICLCKSEDYLNLGNYVERCKETSKCRNIDVNEIEVNDHVILTIEGENIKDTNPYIEIPSNFIELELIKEKDSITIDHYQNE